jgi:F420H(2)-dependent quinone reductase
VSPQSPNDCEEWRPGLLAGGGSMTTDQLFAVFGPVSSANGGYNSRSVTWGFARLPAVSVGKGCGNHSLLDTAGVAGPAVSGSEHRIRGMPLEGEYEPSPAQWVSDQVEEYERSGGQRANTLRDTGLPVVVITTRGNKSGKVRKFALMRVEHNGEYALVASKGGAPQNPVWYYNLKADPDAVTIQDGPEPFDFQVTEVSGDERAGWWERAVAAYPPYAEYQTKTDRQIPVFVARRRA